MKRNRLQEQRQIEMEPNEKHPLPNKKKWSQLVHPVKIYEVKTKNTGELIS